MDILIATSGVLPPARTAMLCDQLLGTDGTATVMTVIQIPRAFIESMDEDERRSFLDDASWDSSTAEVKALSYLEERGRRVVEPMMAALRTIGREAVPKFVEGTDTVEAIVATSVSLGSDLVIMGATKRLFTEQAWKSVSARVMERTACPLLVMPGTKIEETGELPRIEI